MALTRPGFLLLLLFSAGVQAQITVTGVDVIGLEEELQANVRARLGIVSVVGQEGVPESHVVWLYERAPRQIREALEPFGYYSASVDSRIEGEGDSVRAVYTVDAGQRVSLRRVDVGVSGPGVGDGELEKALDSFPLESGEPLDHRAYQQGKRDIERVLDSRGYFDAEPTVHEVRVHPDELAADLELHWQTGERYRFGPVQFDGSQFPDAFMRRFVTFERGEVYHQDRLLELQRALIDTDYFTSVDVNALREEADGTSVPVRITVGPRKRDVYSAGVGYGTDTGARVEGGFQRRWVNRRGHRFRVDAELGDRRSGLNTQYGIPVHRNGVRQYTFGASYLDEVSESVDRRSTELSVAREATWHGWQQLVSLNFLSERFEFASEQMQAPDAETRDSIVVYPMLRLSKSRANDPIVPSRGWRLEGYVRGGHDSLLSDTSFLQIGGQARLIIPGPGRDRLLLRSEAATTWSEDFDRLPASLRYFAGGDRSIRGYDYQALSPLNEEGERIGGKHLLVGSAEYEHMFTGKWGVAAFVDAGNAFTATDFEPEIGTGLGLRWRSPVGMVRFDVASAISEPGDPLEIHLVIGPDL